MHVQEEKKSILGLPFDRCVQCQNRVESHDGQEQNTSDFKTVTAEAGVHTSAHQALFFKPEFMQEAY